ncbi:MAG: HDOD domain-containing protein [Bacteroidales bacterium]|nr:HDOD domain-containing protein [Candidatus Latescibacterota bacterium]
MKTFRRELKEVLSHGHSLPTIPAVVFLLQSALSANDSSADRIGEIIADDPALSTNILRLANSAWYPSSGGPVSTISDAIVKIGLKEIGEFCSTLSVIGTFRNIGSFRNHAMFWKHCIIVAYASKHIVRMSKVIEDEFSGEAYTAGLLHDIGTLILEQYFTDTIHKVWLDAKKNMTSVHDAEFEAFKMDHGQVGGKLLQLWKIPHRIVQAVSWHHRPDKADPGYRHCVQVTHLADCICNYKGFVGAGNLGITELPAAIMEELQIDQGQIDSTINSVIQESKKSEVLISLASGSQTAPRPAATP